MKNQYPTFRAFFLAAFLIGFVSGFGQSNNLMNTPGELAFTVKTITDNGNYAPKHVLAIWVEDEQGFVKTRKLRANQRKQYLYTWKSVSNNNVVDAVTGATMSSHQTHTVTWDCTDVDGNVVPDGDYNIYVEFTEKHAQGPLTSVTFNKGTDEQHLTPPDEDHFVNISLDYIPETTIITEVTNKTLNVYPNPGKDLFTIDLQSDETYDFTLFNSSGQPILHEKNQLNSSQLQIDLSNFDSGIYFVEIDQRNIKQVAKIIKQ